MYINIVEKEVCSDVYYIIRLRDLAYKNHVGCWLHDFGYFVVVVAVVLFLKTIQIVPMRSCLYNIIIFVCRERKRGSRYEMGLSGTTQC